MAAGRNNGAAAACSGLATNSKLKAVSPLAERAAGASTWHRAPEISRPGVPGNAATKFSELLLWRAGLDTKPPLDFPALPSQRGEAHPCPFRGRHGCACWGTGGSGWIPQGRESRRTPSEISQTSSARECDFVSRFLFILGRGSEQGKMPATAREPSQRSG